ncbi:MAG: dihydropteroate synthase [Thermoplasmatota archaeon]
MRVMGILNATPDSFSDGGELDDGLHERIACMIDEGADILDVGGESTRPGHVPVSAEAEIARVVPVIEAIRDIDARVPISIDTSKAAVARRAIDAGATWVNDVRGLTDPEMVDVARHAHRVVLMRSDSIEGDIVAGAARQLDAIARRAIEGGLDASCIILDPGLGFGERPGADVDANLALIDAGAAFGPYPTLIGASRKRFVGTLMAEPDPRRRVAGSVAMAVRARDAGASYVRVHDVRATVEALQR